MSKSTRTRSGTSKTGSRREELRRNLGKPGLGLGRVLQRPEVLSASLILLAIVLVASLLVVWSHDQIKVAPGQVANTTRLYRLPFTVVDQVRTEEAKQEARDRAPDVYTLDGAYLDGLRSPLENLPVLVAEQTDVESISPGVRESYQLDDAAVDRLKRYAVDGRPTAEWTRWIEAIVTEKLVETPILGSDEWQSGLLEPEPPQLLAPTGNVVAQWRDAIRIGDLKDEESTAELRHLIESMIVRTAGVRRDVAGYVAAGIASSVQPTYVKNAALTASLAEERAGLVETIKVDHNRNDVIYRAGDLISEQQIAALRTEQAIYRERIGAAALWLPRLGMTGLIGLLFGFAGLFVVRFYPRILQNNLRIVAIGALMVGTLALAITLTAQVPKLMLPSAVGTTLLVSIILLLAYDQRIALFLGTVQCALTAFALEQGMGWFILLMAGSGAMTSQLRQVRNRNTLIRAAMVTAVVLGVGTLLLGLVTAPPAQGIILEVLGESAWAVAASVVVGFLVLGILPSVEKLFDITTGMTLAELRDPSQPLLRQLQQRAPGTYNHSLQVATIAEAAADAIGADSLLVYVGAMYHDIGKMNKPMYFVENQSGGFNKHSKLTPAMSLLVIIGHVKDGVELAREYGLPRQIQHFIESHHGTTLVEYFYHAARSEAEDVGKPVVDEVEFRYPGPKPRTREAALLMLSDAVESATRAMAEPNPSRIESIVRELSRKRLLDGQFDECDLTFRELGLIEEAMIARLCAIHHGRISYPSTAAKTGEISAPPAAAEPTTPPRESASA